MSVKALIAMKTEDNKYSACWNRNNGFPANLGRILRNVFVTKETVENLIKEGSFGTIYSYYEKMDIEKNINSMFFKKVNVPHTRGWFVSNPIPHFEPMVYDNFNDMLKENQSYIYVFDPGTKKWTTHKQCVEEVC